MKAPPLLTALCVCSRQVMATQLESVERMPHLALVRCAFPKRLPRQCVDFRWRTALPAGLLAA